MYKVKYKIISVQKIIFTVFFILCLSFFSSDRLSARDYYKGFSFGVGGGYEIPFGSFSGQIKNGAGAAFFVDYGLGAFFPGLLGEFEFQYTGWELKNSSESRFRNYGLKLGAVYYYNLNRFFQPYGGLYFKESILNLDAKRLEKKETTFKSGSSIKAGFMSHLDYGLGLRAGMEYSGMSLSNRFFHSMNFNLAITFNYNYLGIPEGQTAAVKVLDNSDDYYFKGERAFEKGNIALAIEMHEKALDIDKKHLLASRALKKIEELCSLNKKAEKYYDEERYFEALFVFDEISQEFPEAKKKSLEIRNILKVKIPFWVQEGINAYEKKNYSKCIILMKRILLVDPTNAVARIYLPRAKKRKQALEKFSK